MTRKDELTKDILVLWSGPRGRNGDLEDFLDALSLTNLLNLREELRIRKV